MNIQPLNDRILVRRDDAEKMTPGGIHIPDTNQEPPLQGEVLAVGAGAILHDGKRRPLDVAIGDRVLFNRYAGTEIEVDDEKLLIMTEGEVHAKVRK